MVAFQKASKKKQKLRLAVYGPSGAGKTFSALRIAKGIGGRVAVIDTEHGSASKYADRFDFSVCELPNKTIDEYIDALKSARGHFEVVVIDSLSHAWQQLLEEIDRLAKAKHKGNTWAAWRDGTPQQRDLVEAILSFPGHVIATMRSKTEWDAEKDSNGKVNPKRVGLAPEQGKGIEYEFDVLMEISVEHIAVIQKDRSGKFQDKTIEKPGEEFGQALAAWLDQGEETPARPALAAVPKPEIVEEKTSSATLAAAAAEADGKVKERRKKAIGFVDSYVRKLASITATVTGASTEAELATARKVFEVEKARLDPATRGGLQHFEPRLTEVVKIAELEHEAELNQLHYSLNDEEREVLAWFASEVKG